MPDTYEVHWGHYYQFVVHNPADHTDPAVTRWFMYSNELDCELVYDDEDRANATH